jgi:hypothetical protein
VKEKLEDVSPVSLAILQLLWDRGIMPKVALFALSQTAARILVANYSEENRAVAYDLLTRSIGDFVTVFEAQNK